MSRKTKNWKIVFICFLLIFTYTYTNNTFAFSPEEQATVSTLEAFFISLKNKNFRKTWELLTQKSQKQIIKDVYKAVRKQKIRTSIEEIEKDFASGGELFKAYWEGFVGVFDPEIALRDCQWKIKKCGKKNCEIELLYKKSRRPAVVKLHKEGEWKVGLVESFWTWKRILKKQ